VAVERLRWMGEHTNHLFRCDTPTGHRLVVRVCLADGRSHVELDAELTWLDALARDTDLTVPVAHFSTRASTPELPAGGRCIAFVWVQGRHCEQRPSRRLVADLGRGAGHPCTPTPAGFAHRRASPARPRTSTT
jgi:Ser/Thr protein kinase RdoA (MazF antagonist)